MRRKSEGDPSEEGQPVLEGDPEVEEDKEEEVANTPPASINVQATITENLNFIFSLNTRAEYRKRRRKESHVASPRPQPTRGASGEVGTKTNANAPRWGTKRQPKHGEVGIEAEMRRSNHRSPAVKASHEYL